MSIGKSDNELKVHEKTVRTAIKQNLNQDIYPLNCVLENKTNATSYRNIGSLTTPQKEEWNKISEEFILKACKSFRRRVDTITEKIKMEAY